MSDSDSSEEGFSTARFRAYLKTLRSQLDKQIQTLQTYLPEEDAFEKIYPLTQPAQDFFGTQKASIQTMFHILLQTWKKEGRLGISGKSVRLNEQEASLFHKKAHTEFEFYDLIRYIKRLQILS